jgi:hypothetical protein
MKTETRIADVNKHLEAIDAVAKAQSARRQAVAAMQQAIDFGSACASTLDKCAAKARESLLAQTAAEKVLAKLPRDRRDLAARTVRIAEEIGTAAARLGEDYSGSTSHSVRWGGSSSAITHTGTGDRYSYACTYRKTDAHHVVTLCPSGVIALAESESLRQLSARDGLYLIDLRDDGSAVWVRRKGKAIVAETGWISGNGQVCYHSTESMEDAQRGFARKLAVWEREQKLARAATETERRARLIARLCGEAVATIADAKRLGYCDPGIAAFQREHNIGDTCPLPQLVRTGNPSAVALALTVARKLSAQRTLATA